MPDQPTYSVHFQAEFPDDLGRLPANVRSRILTAVEKRLGQAPDRYGQRLRQSLHGYWKLRVGDHRVVYEIVGREVRVYANLDRRDVYSSIPRRTTRGWPRKPG